MVGCGKDLTPTGEEYMLHGERGWYKRKAAMRSKEYTRPCGGIAVYSVDPANIRLCMDCAYREGLIW